MKTRVINLTAHEAAGFQRGATVFVRECKVQPPNHDSLQVGIIVSSTDRRERGKFTFGWIDPHGSCFTIRGRESKLYVKAPWDIGDLIIGREAWQIYDTDGLSTVGICYKASYNPFATGSAESQGAVKWFDVSPEIADGAKRTIEHMEVMGESWRSAAVMPQWAARVRRIVTAVSLKRCQELTEGEIEAAGYDGDCPVGHIPSYQAGKHTYHFAQANAKMWAENKFVWVTSVKEEA